MSNEVKTMMGVPPETIYLRQWELTHSGWTGKKAAEVDYSNVGDSSMTVGTLVVAPGLVPTVFTGFLGTH